MSTDDADKLAARLSLEQAQAAYDAGREAYMLSGKKNNPGEVAKFKKLDKELSDAMRAYAKFFS